LRAEVRRHICTNFIQKVGKDDAKQGRLKSHSDTDRNTMFRKIRTEDSIPDFRRLAVTDRHYKQDRFSHGIWMDSLPFSRKHPTKSAQQRPFPEVNICSNSKEISLILRVRRFINAFMKHAACP